MDITKPQKSDGTTTTGAVTLNSPNNVALYTVKIVQSVRITNASKVGEPLLNIALDSALDETLKSISTAYERFSIENLQLFVQSGSPLGTSSGCAQIAHIPDPENAAIPSGGGNWARDKVVRQAGSAVIRPRDSDVFHFPINGEMFTKHAGSKRWSSFGNIVAVVRAVPEASDWAEWSMTLTCNVKLFRTAIVDTAADAFNYDVLLQSPIIKDGSLQFTASSAIPGLTGRVRFLDNFSVRGRVGNITRPFKVVDMPATFDGATVKLSSAITPIDILTHGTKLARLQVDETSSFY